MQIRKNSISDFHPQHLTEEEIKNPDLVIEELFEKEDLPGLRELLWKWLKTATTGNYKELGKIERDNIFFTYELMEKLLEAAHLIRLNQMPDTRSQSGAAKEKEDFEEFDLLPQRLPATRI